MFKEMGPMPEASGEKKIEYPKPKFMLVVERAIAQHKIGDIEYSDGERVIIDGEDSNFFYGRAHLGRGGNLIDQKFPKESLRELTPEEIIDLSNQKFNEPPVGPVQFELSPNGEIESLKRIE